LENTMLKSASLQRTVLAAISAAVISAAVFGVRVMPQARGDDAPTAGRKQSAATFTGTQAGQTRNDNGLKTTLVWIPPGHFTMGSPKNEKGRDDDENQMPVTLSKGFWLGQHEVTQSEWERVMQTTPWRGNDHVRRGDDYPAASVSWDDAIIFCAKLTEQERAAGRLPSDWQYGLPTEAQWEWACRAGTKSRFSFGDDDSDLAQYAWFDKNTWDAGEKYAHRVGQKKANSYGLYDMHGNVWEWCRDWYAKKLSGGLDPLGPSHGSARVYRGGSWSNGGVSSAGRRGGAPDDRSSDLGFRVAAVPSDIKPTPQSGATLAGRRAGQTRNDNDLKTTLVWIPPGLFTMGSPRDEKNRHDDEDQVEVLLTEGFWLGQHEVTQSEWQRVMQTTPWGGQSHVKEGANYPATYVSYDDATTFCEKLTERERAAGHLPSGWHYALPTEAQWEYACRAGAKSRYSFGDDDSKLGDYAWIFKNDRGPDDQYSQAVGQKKANPWGLVDMHGNVWEWCRDWYENKLSGGLDPQGPLRGSDRVFRGGSWDQSAWICRSAMRNETRPNHSSYDLGFRVAAVPSGK
jgi:formylglycine-generating enzyme required for sulfatase activity